MTIGKPWYWVQYRVTGWSADWITLSQHRTQGRAENRLKREVVGRTRPPEFKYRLVKVQEVR